MTSFSGARQYRVTVTDAQGLLLLIRCCRAWPRQRGTVEVLFVVIVAVVVELFVVLTWCCWFFVVVSRC